MWFELNAFVSTFCVDKQLLQHLKASLLELQIFTDIKQTVLSEYSTVAITVWDCTYFSGDRWSSRVRELALENLKQSWHRAGRGFLRKLLWSREKGAGPVGLPSVY